MFSCPELSRFVGMEHLATLVAARVEAMATTEAARAYGTEMRNRLQTVWRRMQYFAPCAPLAAMFGADPDIATRECLAVSDIIDVDAGLVSVIEADGLDIANRRLVLGGILMAVWRYGQHLGDGTFDHHGRGPGTFVIMEEAHELFGSRNDDEDAETAATRTVLYETLFRRSRALGMKLWACLQNPAAVPSATTANVSAVLVHRLHDQKDRDVVGNLMNWQRAIGQHYREIRYLGEMPKGYALARFDAEDHLLESAPVHFLTDPLGLGAVSDDTLATLARRR